ncbi:MAG TPA: hypothetical protein VG890_04525 [Puia sp.]|nr:hypothetical protein [Puia sp.]
MRSLIGFSIAIFSLAACSKSVNPGNPDLSKDTVLLSVSQYASAYDSRSVESFGYNSEKQMASFRIYHYDSTLGPNLDSILVTFSYTDKNFPPAAYDLTWFNDTLTPPNGYTEHHLLFYDDQKRVVEDSTASSSDGSLALDKYFYNTGNIVAGRARFDAGVSGYTLWELDTLFISNGNIDRRSIYDVQGRFDAQQRYVLTYNYFEELGSYQYSSYSNPLFDTDLSNSLGPLLVAGNIGDYFSSKLVSQWTDQLSLNSAPPPTNYNFTTDNAGRVVQAVGNIDGQLTEAWTYTYGVMK